MADLDSYPRTVQAATDSVVKSLLQARHWEDCSFINLPISYPGGGDVTIKVTLNRSGFRVSDNGFAFREAEAYGLNEEKFSYVLSKIVAGTDLNKSQRTIYLDTDFSTLYGAICEVASASWRAAERIASNNEDDDEDDVADDLTDRLVHIFGRVAVTPKPKLTGVSTNSWPMTALVTKNGITVAFQNVTGSTYSIYRTSSAFNDISALTKPPSLIAVVPSKTALGAKLGLISRAGKVIERGQPDDVFQMAAI